MTQNTPKSVFLTQKMTKSAKNMKNSDFGVFWSFYQIPEISGLKDGTLTTP